MSIVNVFSVDCDALDCPDGTLGAMDLQSESCNEVVQSEVNSIIFWHPTLGTAPTNWGPGIAALDFDINNADATDVQQKQIFVTGSVPEPTDTEATVNGFQTVVLSRTHTLTANLVTFGDATYDYLRKLQCGKVKPQFVYTTMGGKLFGKDGGITPSKITANFILNEGEESFETWTITFEWKSLTAPDRLDNPL